MALFALVAAGPSGCRRQPEEPQGGTGTARIVAAEDPPAGVPLPPSQLRLALRGAYVMSGSTSGLMLELSATSAEDRVYEVLVEIPSCDRFAAWSPAAGAYDFRIEALPVTLENDDYRDVTSKFGSPLHPSVELREQVVASSRTVGWRTVGSTDVRVEIHTFGIASGRLSGRMVVDAVLAYDGEEHTTPARRISLDLDLRNAPLGPALVD